MKLPAVLAGSVVIALALTLAGCAPSTPSGPGGSPEPSPSATSTPEEPQAAAVILSLDGIEVQDDTGAALQSATFDDPDAVLALLGSVLGSTPTPTEYPEFGSSTWEWPGVLFGRASDTFSWFRSEVADLGGLPLRTTDGIQIGSTRAEVLALAPFDGAYDMDGDGTSDLFGLEQQTAPGTESLSFPGQPGTDYVEVQLEGDAVSVLRAPSNDYSDV
jgi:hypothetical protein